jgi:hypothetical protein
LWICGWHLNIVNSTQVVIDGGLWAPSHAGDVTLVPQALLLRTSFGVEDSGELVLTASGQPGKIRGMPSNPADTLAMPHFTRFFASVCVEHSSKLIIAACGQLAPIKRPSYTPDAITMFQN